MATAGNGLFNRDALEALAYINCRSRPRTETDEPTNKIERENRCFDLRLAGGARAIQHKGSRVATYALICLASHVN